MKSLLCIVLILISLSSQAEYESQFHAKNIIEILQSNKVKTYLSEENQEKNSFEGIKSSRSSGRAAWGPHWYTLTLRTSVEEGINICEVPIKYSDYKVPAGVNISFEKIKILAPKCFYHKF